MTIEEQDARRLLETCKRNAKEALLALDPAPAEPISGALLKLIDAADRASKSLSERMGPHQKTAGGAQ